MALRAKDKYVGTMSTLSNMLAWWALCLYDKHFAATTGKYVTGESDEQVCSNFAKLTERTVQVCNLSTLG